MTDPIKAGDRVITVDAFGVERQRLAVTGVVDGADFEVVWVSPPAGQQGCSDAIPWPAEDVRLNDSQEGEP